MNDVHPRQACSQGRAFAAGRLFSIGSGCRHLGRLWGRVLRLGAGLRQGLGLVKQPTLSGQLFGAGAEHALTGQHGLFEHANDVIVGFLANGLRFVVHGLHDCCVGILLGHQECLEGLNIVRQNARQGEHFSGRLERLLLMRKRGFKRGKRHAVF